MTHTYALLRTRSQCATTSTTTTALASDLSDALTDVPGFTLYFISLLLCVIIYFSGLCDNLTDVPGFDDFDWGALTFPRPFKVVSLGGGIPLVLLFLLGALAAAIAGCRARTIAKRTRSSA